MAFTAHVIFIFVLIGFVSTFTIALKKGKLFVGKRSTGTNDGPVVPVLEYDNHFCAYPLPKTLAHLKFELVIFIRFFIEVIIQCIANRGKWCEPFLGVTKR